MKNDRALGCDVNGCLDRTQGVGDHTLIVVVNISWPDCRVYRSMVYRRSLHWVSCDVGLLATTNNEVKGE